MSFSRASTGETGSRGKARRAQRARTAIVRIQRMAGYSPSRFQGEPADGAWADQRLALESMVAPKSA